MASGRWTTSASPSTCIHSPKNASVMTQNDTCGSRWRFRVFTAVSRVLTMILPMSSTAQSTGDVCGRPSAWWVTMTARGWAPMKSRARPGSTMRNADLEPDGAAVQLVLVDECRGVAVGKPVLVRQPVDPLVATEEGRAVIYGLEPLGEVTSCDFRDACDEILVRLR